MFKDMDTFNDELLLYEEVFELAAIYTPEFDLNINLGEIFLAFIHKLLASRLYNYSIITKISLDIML